MSTFALALQKITFKILKIRALNTNTKVLGFILDDLQVHFQIQRTNKLLKIMAYENTSVHLNSTEHRFQMNINGEYAFINYQQAGDKFYLVHTEVPESLEGQGVAAVLVEKTLQYLEDHDLKMVPWCSYVQHYLLRHPEWNRLVVKEE